MAITFFSINGAGAGGGASAVNTANGISGDGSVGTPVILGGNPLNQGTTIALAGNSFEFNDNDGTNHLEFFQSATLFQVELFQPGEFGSFFNMQGNAGGDAAGYFANMKFIDIGAAGHTKSLEVSGIAGTGVAVVDQVDNIGLLDSDLHAVSSNKQYAQYGNISHNVASVNVPGLINISANLNYTVAAGGEFLRVNPWALYRTGTGSVTITINYKDNGGTNRTITLAAISSIAPVLSINPSVFFAQSLSTVNINWAVVGLITYDQAATIEKML